MLSMKRRMGKAKLVVIFTQENLLVFVEVLAMLPVLRDHAAICDVLAFPSLSSRRSWVEPVFSSGTGAVSL